MTEVKYIVIEGVIGAGKTTLAHMVAERLQANLVLEEFQANPFLEKFYENPDVYAFQTQMFFLINRFKQQEQLIQEELFSDYIVSDYIFDKDKIFAYLNLSQDELKLYENIFPLLQRDLRKPDLVVYLQSSVDRLMHNIRSRDRKIERQISRKYIDELSEAYNNFFFKYNQTPLLIVNSTEIDFVNNQDDFEELCSQIFRDDRTFMEYFHPQRKGK